MNEWKRRNLSVDKKIEALSVVKRGVKKCDVAKRIGVPANTLSTWIKKKDRILETFNELYPSRKRHRLSPYADLETSLIAWLKQTKNKGLISRPHLIDQVKRLADQLGYVNFCCSSGWLDRFK